MGAIGLARRAGALAAGYDAAKAAAQGGGAALVLLAEGTSAKTGEGVRRFCSGRCPVHAVPPTQEDLARLLGKNTGVLAVTDKNLADLCLKYILCSE